MTQWKVCGLHKHRIRQLILIICLQSKLNLPDDANLDSEEAKAKLELGLFSYPVLQAADILLYQSVIHEIPLA